MDYFHYVNEDLWCEEMPLAKVAKEVGTPFYLYSYKTLNHHFNIFDESFSGIPHIVCFAAKANSNIAILKIFAQLGGGVDIVSGGELYRALLAGVNPLKIVYSGVGKKVEEIEYALKSNILMFNVESAQELEAIDACAGRLKKKAGIALRVNPDVDAQTHPHISTGLKENKFGIDVDMALQQYRLASQCKNLEIKGISCHIGSQITKIAPFLDAFGEVKKLLCLLQGEGISIKYIDLGGGLGIRYNQEEPPHPSDYAKALMAVKNDLDCTFIFEPGRVIVGNAGILVARVLYTKENSEKNFIIVDAGMNDLVRPSMYNSYHDIRPVKKRNAAEALADVVGPICESGDFLTKGRLLPKFKQGELLAVMSAGAYGFAMSSNYNSRPRVAEVLVKDDRYFIIRKREDYADLVRGEEIQDLFS
jgi:diaminopimelate decarboxylase